MRKILQKLSTAILGIATIVSAVKIAPAAAAPVELNVTGRLNAQVISPPPEYGDKTTAQEYFKELLKGSFEGTFSYDAAQTGKPVDGYDFYSYSISDFHIDLFQSNGDLYGTISSDLDSSYIEHLSEESDGLGSRGFIRSYNSGKLELYWSLIHGDLAMDLQFQASGAIDAAIPPKAGDFLTATFQGGSVSEILVGGVVVADATITTAAPPHPSSKSVPEPCTLTGLGILGLGWALKKKKRRAGNALQCKDGAEPIAQTIIHDGCIAIAPLTTN